MRLGLAWLVVLVLGGCTMLTAFDAEGQPCDKAAAPASQCLTGFHCSNDKCVRGAFDGGM